MKHILLIASLLLLWSPGVLAEEAPAGNVTSTRAVFAGGCFWCMEQPFDELRGVLDTTVGYIGGSKENAQYRKVASGATRHTEAIEIVYDPKLISYGELLRVFWRNIDPTQKNGQFCDWGTQYRSGIYYSNDEEKKEALKSLEWAKKQIKEKGQFHTEILKAGTFYPGEGYHQNYYKTNPLKYKSYRVGCGRDRRLLNIWGKK